MYRNAGQLSVGLTRADTSNQVKTSFAALLARSEVPATLLPRPCCPAAPRQIGLFGKYSAFLSGQQSPV